jgi:hypothetical protein
MDTIDEKWTLEYSSYSDLLKKSQIHNVYLTLFLVRKAKFAKVFEILIF